MDLHRSAMGRWLAFGLVALLTACAHVASPAAGPLREARQLVLVTTPGWDADRGTLQRFERFDGTWRPVGDAVPVMVGRNGTACALCSITKPRR